LPTALLRKKLGENLLGKKHLRKSPKLTTTMRNLTGKTSQIAPPLSKLKSPTVLRGKNLLLQELTTTLENPSSTNITRG